MRRGARRLWHMVPKLLNLLVYCDLADSRASSYNYVVWGNQVGRFD